MAYRSRKASTSRRPVRRARPVARRSTGVRRGAKRTVRRAAPRDRTLRIVIEQAGAPNPVARPDLTAEQIGAAQVVTKQRGSKF